VGLELAALLPLVEAGCCRVEDKVKGDIGRDPESLGNDCDYVLDYPSESLDSEMNDRDTLQGLKVDAVLDNTTNHPIFGER
jgi:hypothetical protein